MADVDTSASAEVDDIDKRAADDAQLAKKWNAEIAAAEKSQAKWVERAKKIERIYNDERDQSTGRSRKFNILWSNVETLRPAVYMQTPKAQAVRRYRDRDPIARFGAMLIERGVQTSCELYDFDHAIDQAVRDRLVVGRGQAWAFYMPGEVGEGEQAMLAYEDVQADYIPWPDFLHSVSRTWSDVWWVGRWFHKSRAELRDWLKERGLDPRAAATVAMDVTPEGTKTDEGLKDERAKARICEVWDKRGQQVLYVAPGSGDRAIIGQTPPPVRFRDFFPCPRPMLSTTTAKSLIPTPDYALYQDQAEELNRCSDRIGVLQKALKVVGVYDSSATALAQMLESSDNKMIPVEGWAMFKEGGGARERIEYFPIEQVANVLKGLYEIREQAKQTLYEVSGIGDILRGATDPDETATAQGIKAKWGSLRVRRIQKDVQRFAADIMRLKAEILTEQVQFSNLLKMAGVDEELLSKYVPMPPMPEMPPEAEQNPQAQQMMQAQQKQAQGQAIKQFLGQVEALLKDDTARNFRIDVESDSALEPDMQEEKQTAVEFMTAMTMYMKEAAPMAAQGPEAAKLVGEILLFGVRRFDKVDQLEQVIEQAVEAASKPRPPQPDPEMMKAEAKVKADEASMKIKAATAQAGIEATKEKTQVEVQSKVALAGMDMQIKQAEGQQRAAEGEQQLALQRAQGTQALRAGEQKMSLAERAAKAKRDIADGGPPE